MERPKGSAISRVGGWCCAIAAGVALTSALGVALAGLGWPPALVSEFAAPSACIVLLGLVTSAALRRPRTLALLSLCLVVLGASLFPRRAPLTRGDAEVRLLVHNAHTSEADVSRVLRQARQSGADVVVLVEVNPELVRGLRGAKQLAEDYPHRLMCGPAPGRTSWRIVLSRWPLEDRRTQREMCCLVLAPTGGFALIAVHPASPRDPVRWRAGNEIVRTAAAQARAFAAEGFPVIVAGDLNSTPPGWRSRTLCREGRLARCKPLLHFSGTFPSGAPAPLRLALDDAWVSPGWRVRWWAVTDASGSDHSAVHIGLAR